MSLNPLMLTLAREARGYTQAQLSKRIGITQGALSKLEAGHLAATDDVLERLSRELEYPRELFTERLVFRRLPISFYRKRATVSAKTLRSITARINLIRRQVELLLRSVDLPELRLPLVDLGERKQSVEQIARELRARWHLPSGPIGNLIQVVEDAGVVVARCAFGTNKVDALSVHEQQDNLPPLIVMSDALPGDRLRFSVAHELGHIVLHHHEPFAERDIEGEANRFASELLMPAADIKGYLRNLTLERLASLKPYWKVSMQALLMRAQQLETISDYRARRLWMQIGAAGYRTEEPLPLAIEEPTLLTEVIGLHLDRLGYSEEELRSLVHLNDRDFQAQYGHFRSQLRVVR